MKTTVRGLIKTTANSKHPLQTLMQLVLTDFEPNANNQGIPLDEKENIIATAQYQPIKMNFDGRSEKGHLGAYPLGPIISVYDGKHNGKDAIFAEAVVWDELFEDESEYLKEAFASGVGTSWEIYYDHVTEQDNVQWLHGCVFAGTCVVDVPAYGPERTRILAIAEKLGGKLEEDTIVDETVASITPAPIEEVRTEIASAQEILFNMYDALESMYAETFEIERNSAARDITTIAESFATLITSLNERLVSLKSAKSELDLLRQNEEAAKAQAARNAIIIARRDALEKAGITYTDEAWAEKSEKYLTMDADVFTDLVSVKRTVASAQSIIPEPIGSTVYTINDIAKAIRGR